MHLTNPKKVYRLFADTADANMNFCEWYNKKKLVEEMPKLNNSQLNTVFVYMK